MWQSDTRRSAEFDGSKGFSLPTAKAHFAPDRPASVKELRIEIWIDPPAERIKGRVTMALRLLTQVRRIALDAAELDITGVTDASGRDLQFTVEDDQLTIDLQEMRPPGSAIDLDIRYSGTPRRGLYFIKPSAFSPDRTPEVWTQGQDDDSRHWFPCFDAPNQKATTELIAHVPSGMFALSNGVLVERTDGERESVFHYRQETPHSTYLISLVVGDYVAIESTAGQTPVTSYVHPADEPRGRLTFSRTAEMVELFSRTFGLPYPYPRYAQICVADFIFGGMENTAATTLTDQILFDAASEADFRPAAESLIAHELAHQWWGDLVTCADWSHAWLNEGFATYAEILWKAHAQGDDAADYGRFQDQEAYFAERYRRPLVERHYEEPIDLFDRHQYEKGSCVLHMIRQELGDAEFWRALREYGQRHGGQTVESDDLRRSIESTTGRNLESFFQQWVYSPGHPRITLSGAYDADHETFRLVVEQTQKGERIPQAFAFSTVVRVVGPEWESEQRVEIKERKQVIHLPAPKRPDYVVFDLGGHVTKQIDYRFPSSMLRSLLDDCEDVHAAIAAVRTLARRADSKSLEALFETLRDHPAFGVRLETARALANVPTKDAKDALLEAVIQEGDARVRRAAIRALGKFRGFAEEVSEVLIRHAESETSDYAIADVVRTVADLRTPEAVEFVRAARTRGGHNRVIEAAAFESLAKLERPDLIDEMLEGTSDAHHPKVREAATTAIGNTARRTAPQSFARARVGEGLVDLLDDPWLRVRIKAAEALAKLEDRHHIAALDRAADRELDGRARRAMRLAVRGLQQRGAATEQISQLRDEVRALRAEHLRLVERLERLEARQTARRWARVQDAKSKKKKKKKKEH